MLYLALCSQNRGQFLSGSKIVGRRSPRFLEVTFCLFQIAFARRKLGKADTSSGTELWYAVRGFIGFAGFARFAKTVVGSAQVVGNLRIRSIASIYRLKIIMCFIEAQQGCAQAPCGLASCETVEKFRERILITLQCLKKPAVELLVVAELDPIIFGSTFRLRKLIRLLWPGVNFRHWRPLILVLFVPQNHGSLRVAELKRIFLLWLRIRSLVRPRMLRRQVSLRIEDSLISGENANRSAAHGLVQIEPGEHRVPLTAEVNYTGQIRPGNSPNFAYRHPVFRETDRLPGLEKRVSFLIAKQSCLNFHVRAVIVG